MIRPGRNADYTAAAEYVYHVFANFAPPRHVVPSSPLRARAHLPFVPFHLDFCRCTRHLLTPTSYPPSYPARCLRGPPGRNNLSPIHSMYIVKVNLPAVQYDN
uniref:Uncharacterized protein n=1 Tax=Steinernema glaseri TaxID=37863 RepID=A0A1I8AFE4_9BILA